ncbi:MAG TPA: carboxypeptidase regulatory-like domain-containing protein [Blastocatellia bacterium]|nr:carboxypeptidase regulatory-like domain-containing protein [Blastocatellia bacterium]
MSKIKTPLLSVWIAVFCLAPCGQLFAQTVTGTISGAVTDPAGAIIPGANVRLINEQTRSVRTLTSDEDGRFSFAGTQPGVYLIIAEHAGFQRLEQRNIVLSANESLAIGNLELSPGQVSEMVTVTTHGDRVETKSSDLTARLTADQLDLISTKGRDITSLLRLLPGVSYIDDIEAVGEGFGTDLPVISGQRGRSTVATVDGLNASEPSGNNKISMTTNQDAIAEVKVLRNNYAAEFGINGGAQITIVSKGGTRDYHGSGYYFIRNEALTANNFFNNRQGLPRPLYRHNIWGFNIGGPVQIPGLFSNKERNKLFFFFSYEQPHTITPVGAKFVTVPTELELQGDFSKSFVGFNSTTGLPVPAFIRDPRITTGACSATDQRACFRDLTRATASNPQGLNIIPRDRLNSAGLAILSAFVRPNQTGRAANGNTFNFVTQRSVDVPKRSTLTRVDFKPTDKDSFYVKAQTWTSDNLGFDTSGWPGGDNNRWGIDSHYLYQDDGVAVNWVRVINPNIVNELFIGARHDSEGFIPGDGEIERFSRAKLGYNAPQLFPDNNKLGTIPRATGWGGLSQTTVANINWLDRWGEIGNDYILPAISDNLTITRGNHSYKAGLYFERMRNGEAPGGNWTGTFDFSSNVSAFSAALGNTGHPYANALIGSFRRYSETSSRPHTDAKRVLLQWYGQDQWQVNRQFTLNYGIRMGWYTHWAPRETVASNFDPTRFNPAKALVLYRPFCVGGTPPIGTACATGSRRALNPVTGELSTNTNLVGTFVPGVGDKLNGLALAEDPTVPKGFRDAPPILWEPRFGFAWDPFGNHRTVLRGHFGVYHANRVGGGTNGGPPTGNPPFQRTVQIDFGNIDNLVNLIGTSLERPTALSALEVHAKTPTTYNFSLGIQQEIGFKSVLEISYVGSLSRHLGERRNLNGVPDTARFVDLHPENRDPFSNSTTAPVLGDDFLRPYQGYSDINMVMYSGSSNYNGLQVQLNRRYVSGFQFGVAYTFAKTLDYANDDSSDVAFPRPYRPFNYGPSDQDQTQIFTANYIWDIPGLGRIWNHGLIKGIFDGWQLSGTTSLVSGIPKNVTFSYTGGLTDYTGGEINARPFVICDPSMMSNGVPSRDQLDGTPILVNAACFSRPTARGQIGNLGRNILRRPGVVNTDLAIFKNFNLGEKRKFVFRWETYNTFNHTNFRDIDAGLTFALDTTTGVVNQTNRRFGQPTSARSGRVMQGSLRIIF